MQIPRSSVFLTVHKFEVKSTEILRICYELQQTLRFCTKWTFFRSPPSDVHCLNILLGRRQQVCNLPSSFMISALILKLYWSGHICKCTINYTSQYFLVFNLIEVEVLLRHSLWMFRISIQQIWGGFPISCPLCIQSRFWNNLMWYLQI